MTVAASSTQLVIRRPSCSVTSAASLRRSTLRARRSARASRLHRSNSEIAAASTTKSTMLCHRSAAMAVSIEREITTFCDRAGLVVQAFGVFHRAPQASTLHETVSTATSTMGGLAAMSDGERSELKTLGAYSVMLGVSYYL